MVFSVKTSGVAAILSLVACVAAHGHVKGLTVDGKLVKGFDLADAYQTPTPESIGWKTTALDNGFVEPAKFGTSDIACHLGGTPGKLFATVAAGSEVTLHWDTWPDSHKGPVLDYLAPYADSAADLKFFKIAEAGFSNGKWAADSINAASGFTWKTTIPSDIAPGKYVLRHEIIALHGSTSENGAQNYPQCLNLEITGSGTAKPAGVSATAFYKSTDPGILIPNFYNGLTSYTIPGPAVYSSGGASPAPQPTPTEPEEEAPEETSAAPVPTSTTTPTETEAPAPGNPEPTPTSIPTPEPEPTQPPAETPAPAPASELPEGTKLSSVLAWLSKFYATHKEFDGETALKRRHARQF